MSEEWEEKKAGELRKMGFYATPLLHAASSKHANSDARNSFQKEESTISFEEWLLSFGPCDARAVPSAETQQQAIVEGSHYMSHLFV